MSKFLWLLDPGHGGLKNGVYQTKGKQWHYPGGMAKSADTKYSIYEGHINRNICHGLCDLLEKNELDHIVVAPGSEDCSLSDRVDLANEFAYARPSIYISLHCNAGGGTGWEIFHHHRASEDTINYSKVFWMHMNTQHPLRSRGIKKANFKVLRETVCPALLFEFGFMDTWTPDAEFLLSEEGQRTCVRALFNGILFLEEVPIVKTIHY